MIGIGFEPNNFAIARRRDGRAMRRAEGTETTDGFCRWVRRAVGV
jgi:hypothetical protein